MSTLAILCSLCFGFSAFLGNASGADMRTVVLPQGWRISPVGTQIRLRGDFPSRIIAPGDRRHFLVLTTGFHDQGVSVAAISTRANPLFFGLGHAFGDMALDEDTGALYISAGGAAIANPVADKLFSKDQLLPSSNVAALWRGAFADGKLSMDAPITLRKFTKANQYVTGIAIGQDHALFAVDIENDRIYKLAPKTYDVVAEAVAGYGAFRAAVSPDGNTVAVSNWGDRSVSLFETSRLKLIGKVPTGDHPNALAFAKDGRLFVTNAGSNSVTVISGTQVLETIKTSLFPSDPVGSTPNALAIDPGNKRLYIANAGNNDVAVIDIRRQGHSEVEGFIPTGWYPSALEISKDGKTLFVGVAKGLASRPNVPATGTARRTSPGPGTPYDFVGDTLTGYVSVINVPSERSLKTLTEAVINNTPAAQPKPEEADYATSIRTSVFPRIHHVLYIIRENRTFDQVLGDLGRGNGDPALTLFGESVTPNAHRMTKNWVIFDNLFVNGEVSENGHQWSDAAYATDFTSQAWLQSYGGRREPKATESELGADERLRSSPAGYIWDNCARHGLSYRTYGEFAYFHSGPDEGPRFVAKGLEGHASLDWLRIAASGWTDIRKGRDPELANVFIRELQDAERSGTWPQFMVMSLGEDHTHALRPGHYTPAAMVASNDQALGQIVEAISHSRFWPDTAIFVIEDDAQDGPDHVDCRRTVGLAISPYVKRSAVDSNLYTTASMIHTMELILRLPPMTQFDRAAMPMYAAFTTHPDFSPYRNLPPETDVLAKNPATGPDAKASLRLDFSAYDRADPYEMNRILWRAMRPGVAIPAPVRNAFVDVKTKELALSSDSRHHR